jgi:hypothetical protein
MSEPDNMEVHAMSVSLLGEVVVLLWLGRLDTCEESKKCEN